MYRIIADAGVEYLMSDAKCISFVHTQANQSLSGLNRLLARAKGTRKVDGRYMFILPKLDAQLTFHPKTCGLAYAKDADNDFGCVFPDL